ncbi:MAG TPA: DUF4430 domain-containing protein [Candidatus Saccharimonadales bacterium]
MRDKHSTSKILVTITLLVLLLVGSATTLVAWRISDEKPAPKQAVAADHTTAAVKSAPITHLSYKGVEGKTALELLKQHARVVTKDSSYGEYVDSINGVVGGTSGKYWTFYVNGAQAQVGAGAYTTHSTDSIEWKFE